MDQSAAKAKEQTNYIGKKHKSGKRNKITWPLLAAGSFTVVRITKLLYTAWKTMEKFKTTATEKKELANNLIYHYHLGRRH
jgi:hypothetical protein